MARWRAGKTVQVCSHPALHAILAGPVPCNFLMHVSVGHCCRADVKTGKLEELLGPEEVGLPNGMAWDTARRTMYFVDTYAGMFSSHSISNTQ